MAHQSKSWIYKKVIGDFDRNGFRKYFVNTSWVFIARMVAYGVSFLTIAIVARYLGPENFGKLSYAQVFISIFSVFASLGIDQILQRELIARKEHERSLLGTAFILKLACGTLAALAAIITALSINEDQILSWLIAVISLSFILQPANVVAQVFAAEVKSQYLAYATIAVAFIIPLTKVVLVTLGEGIIYFAATLTLEALIYGIAYVAMYYYLLKRSFVSWTFNRKEAVLLMQASWPLMLASFSGYIYGRIDQVMILHYLDATSVGLYDIAVRITEMLGFVPGVIIGSLFPALINAKKQSTNEYKKRWKALITLTVGIAFLSATIIYIAAPLIITLLFGEAFTPAIPLLQIYVWSIVGTIGIILMQQFFIAEGSSREFLYFSVLGALTNIGLNMLLIPKKGMFGAAIATIITVSLVITVFEIRRRIITKNN
jgi:O-antigen/teichoic acid export membrane protein